ncbi:MAG: FAD-binding oxidoreductase [Actinomycetota bacterium]|nr:FAD-binding oxidoreductase [Actinomycetota bacterium]
MLTSAADQRYELLVARIADQYSRIPEGSTIRLAKQTSNLFRPRAAVTVPGLDVASFDGVLKIDQQARTAEVLGMTTYEHLVAATLPLGLMPLCIPQLRTITLGGAVTGLGIEAASFRQGSPHESVIEMDILTGAGEVVTVTGAHDDPHRDLFYGFPNSYGSLGYALRITIELEPALPYVHLRHIHFASSTQLTEAIAQITSTRLYEDEPVDFIDGSIFSDREHYLSLGTMHRELPPGIRTSDYTGEQPYYRSIQSRSDDYLTVHDYLWRWDTDWFWCSRAFGAQQPLVRKFWPKSKLRSDVYWKFIALDHRYDISGKLNRLQRKPQREAVVQDIEVPINRLPEFLEFFHQEVGISPIWICPLKQRDPQASWPLYEFDPDTTYVNVGFWSSVPVADDVDPKAGLVNRRIEAKVTELDGRKSLYSTSFYDQTTFWSIYGGTQYPALKTRYDPAGRLLGLYEKVVEQR